MSGTTLPGPQVDVEVALGIGSIYPGGVWDSGTFGFNTWGDPETDLGDWTDVTCDTVDGFTLGSGTSPDGVVTSWEGQTCALTLVGDVYDPRSGPYVGLLGPGLPVRVRWRATGAADWLTTFVGWCDDDGFTYDPTTSQASIAATDGTRIFAGFDGLEQPAIGQGERASDRVLRIAGMVGWSDLDVTAGGVALQATTLAGAAWSLLLAVADTDPGPLVGHPRRSARIPA